MMKQMKNAGAPNVAAYLSVGVSANSCKLRQLYPATGNGGPSNPFFGLAVHKTPVCGWRQRLLNREMSTPTQDHPKQPPNMKLARSAPSRSSLTTEH